MKNNVEPQLLSQLDAVFEQLDSRVVEEFYAAYQQWSVQQHIRELRQRIDMVHEQQAENEQRIQQMRPSAISLAALARLQSNGVGDMALLDAMLERGEAWLDQTMQRLDYFEQFDDFVSDDYTQWCQGALEGAFDWIDSLRDAPTQDAPVSSEEAPLEEMAANSEEAGDVEALLLQRLAIEDKEDDLSWQDATTLKRAAIQVSVEESVTAAPGEKPEETVSEEATLPEPETVLQAAEYIPQEEPGESEETLIDATADGSSSREEQIIPEEALPVEANATSESDIEQPALVEFAPAEESISEEELHIEDEQPALVEFAPIGELVAGEGIDMVYPVDEQPTLVEFASVEKPVTGETESDMQDEQPAFVEFAAPAEISQADETIDKIAEQATFPEIAIAEDSASSEEIVQGEASEVENNTNAEIPAPEQRAIPSSEPVMAVRNAPRKRGLIGILIWILTGK